MTRQTWVIATMAILFTSPLFAVDIVTRKSDGKKVSGTISAMSKTELSLKKQVGEPEAVAANDVAVIEYEGGGSELRLGNSDENNGKYESALNRYAKAKADAKSPSENLRAEFDYVIARAAAQEAISDAAKQDEAVKQLLAAQKAYPDYFRYYESIHVLSQLYLAMGNFGEARSTTEILTKAPWNETKMLAMIASGKIYVAENKLDEAAKEFESAAAAATDSPADQGRKYQAMLGQARALLGQGKLDDAIKILEEVTDKAPADNSVVQAESYVLLGNALQSLSRPKEAALAYLHLDVLPNLAKDTSLHAEALYNLSKTWKQVQLLDRSADAAAKLELLYPNSPWRKKLAAGQ